MTAPKWGTDIDRRAFLGWTGVAAADRLTWKSDGRFASTTFDYILTRGLGKPTATLWKASEDASDHGPVVLKIEIP